MPSASLTTFWWVHARSTFYLSPCGLWPSERAGRCVQRPKNRRANEQYQITPYQQLTCRKSTLWYILVANTTTIEENFYSILRSLGVLSFDDILIGKTLAQYLERVKSLTELHACCVKIVFQTQNIIDVYVFVYACECMWCFCCVVVHTHSLCWQFYTFSFVWFAIHFSISFLIADSINCISWLLFAIQIKLIYCT